MDAEWTEYKCKSGEVMFLYNKTTGEHKWPDQFSEVSISRKYSFLAVKLLV